MRFAIRSIPLRVVALLVLTIPFTISSGQAAPIQGTLDLTTGAVTISGFTGEIFCAIRGPENLLLPANALINGSYTLDATLPGEIAYLGLGGMQGALNVGNVVKAGLPIADLQQLQLAYQVSFTSEIIELPAGVSSAPGRSFLIIFPEPASFSLLVISVGAVTAANRLRNGRQRCLAVSS